MRSRRKFIRDASVIALAPTVPLFLPKSTSAADVQDTDGRILVVVEFDGGNDGINTVIPFADEGYAKHRSELRLRTDSLLKLNNMLGLHPACRALADLFEMGELAVVQGVSYPNPDRSHFRSRAIWQSARLATQEHGKTGWLGMALDQRKASGPDAVFVGNESLPVALRGRRANCSVMLHDGDSAQMKLLGPTLSSSNLPSDAISLHDFVARTVEGTYRSSGQTPRLDSGAVANAGYPETDLAKRLKLISGLIKSGQPTPVYYAMQSGYDTHANQLPTHERLMGEFSGAVNAFFSDLREAGLAERVLLLTTSEFGRRVAENNSLGTDHGTAGPVFLIGRSVRGGFHGDAPSLTKLESGDLISNFDFRQVYAAIIEDWLNLESTSPLGGQFGKLDLVASGHTS